MVVCSLVSSRISMLRRVSKTKKLKNIIFFSSVQADMRKSDTQELLLHYIPERNIPHLDEVPTIDEDRPMVGVQRFIIKPPKDQAIRDHHICSIDIGLFGQIHKFVKHASNDPRLGPIVRNLNIRARCAGGWVRGDADRMISVQRHPLIDIGAKRQDVHAIGSSILCGNETRSAKVEWI